MFLLILDSLGSTELFFILVMALVFFGPRKLPQLSRSLGKNIAEFRKASEDFKRTWEREVAFEESHLEANRSPSPQPANNSISHSDQQGHVPPLVEPVPASESVGRHGVPNTSEGSSALTEGSDETGGQIKPEPARKQDWL